jgi:hypothetical protein
MREAVVRNSSNWMLVRDSLRMSGEIGLQPVDSVCSRAEPPCPIHVHIDKAIRRSKRTGMFEGYLLLCLILARTSNRSESVSRHPVGFDGCSNHRYTDAFDRGQSIGPKTVRHLFIETAYR